MNDDRVVFDRDAVAWVIAHRAQALSDLAEQHGFAALAYMLSLAVRAARDEQDGVGSHHDA